MGLRPLREVIDEMIERVNKLREAEAAEHGLTIDQFERKIESEIVFRYRLEALQRSGIHLSPRSLGAIASNHFRKTTAAKFVKRWAAEDERPILVLCGPIGTGKTFAAGIAIASAGFGTAIKSMDLPRRVRPYHAEIEQGAQPLQLRQRLIVLDDLGTEVDSKNKRWAEAFADFIEHRQQYGRTIITTNMPAKEFRDRYDERIIDRLNACSRAIELQGESMRDQNGGY